MIYKQSIEAINHDLFERIEADTVAHLPGQYLGTGQGIHSHAALTLLVQLGEPGPDVRQLGRQLWHRRRFGHPVKRILPGGVQVITFGIAVACRCSPIKQVIGVQQQGLG